MTTIITSLNPNIKRLDGNGVNFGADYQRQCVESWIAVGAKVVSLNSRNEIKNLAKMGYNVNFLPVDVEPFKAGGRALPSISDAVQFAATHEDEIVLITNSDIFFKADKKYLRHLEEIVGVNDFVYASRVDVNNLQSNSGGVYTYGYDVFAFHSSKGSNLDLSGFNFGSPWWDYWIPINAMFAGMNLKWLQSDNFLHIDHDNVWDWPEWNIGFVKFIKKFQRRLDYRDPVMTPQDFTCGFSKFLFSLAANDECERNVLHSTAPLTMAEQMGTFVRLALEMSAKKVR